MRPILLLTLLLASKNLIAESQNPWAYYLYYGEDQEIIDGPFYISEKLTTKYIHTTCDRDPALNSLKLKNRTTKEIETFICSDFFPTEKD